MQLRSALLAATVLAMPFAASAQPVTGLYVGAGAGVNITQQENIKNLSFPTLAPLGGGLAHRRQPQRQHRLRGRGLRGLGLRQRAAGRNRRQLPQQQHRRLRTALHAASAAGRRHATSRSTAAWSTCCTTSTASSPWVVPYLGAGVGYVGRQREIPRVQPNGVADSRRRRRQRFGPGASTRPARTRRARSPIRRSSARPSRLPRCPGLAFTAEYRFLGTAGNRVVQRHGDRDDAAGATLRAPATVQSRPSYNHSILVGLRYNFGVAPPPPPPARRRFRPRLRRAPTWCSSIGTRRRSPIARARSSRKRRTTRPRCSTRGSR